MKKRKSSINKLKLNKIGFQSSTSIYKEKFSEEEITFKPKFSITKSMTFDGQKKAGNKLAKHFVRLKESKL